MAATQNANSSAGATPFIPAPNRWRLRDVAYAIGGARLIDGISLELARGELVGVLGPNGAGKSTLLRAATGLIAPSAGAVLADESDIARMPRRDVARAIAFVPQDTHVEFAFTAWQIAMMGRNPRLGRFQWPGAADEAAVRAAMEATETFAFAERSATTLSGGERQRVFLARALATESPFIALDEPTANLDIRHALHFLALLRKLVHESNRGALVAIHNLDWAARYCDRLVVLDKGRMVAQGAPEEVMLPEIVRDVFQVNMEIVEHGEGKINYYFENI